MSDCSTEAMEPKELPKTCGKCGDDTPACNFLWERNQELEQRYHQLEQVAWDMYSFIAINEAISGFTIRGQRKPTDKIMSLATFREQLESLGVSVDG